MSQAVIFSYGKKISGGRIRTCDVMVVKRAEFYLLPCVLRRISDLQISTSGCHVINYLLSGRRYLIRAFTVKQTARHNKSVMF